MKPQEPEPVKFFCGILFGDPVLLEQVKERLEEKYGPIDTESERFDFDGTHYYREEMGAPLYRVFVSFKNWIHPKDISRIKLETNALENEFSGHGKRKINLDPGYMDVGKVVLASAKYNIQKIYLDHGIYADLTLHYEKGHFSPYPWSFPDFKSNRYERTFLLIHERFKVQHKKWVRENQTEKSGGR
ncbi:hypothetical protein BMS3Abin05_00448 [bacterium BMS3Abin05]|nr:hypothetical protein BMS3Abin05_00448 [bacterium BMS3Abin05]GBE27972.1 hypothetical protein BMS3Bbin03_01907 [bacterium BMS3Bbin03]HDK35625.1 DUF4416 family protein [Bacteroidota bacterium]HDL78220.1 DUF4416 family protein [Bacteroidota bacterium]HDZ12763.1 DUF4416 family protein [Bacteroidota bacterium]